MQTLYNEIIYHKSHEVKDKEVVLENLHDEFQLQKSDIVELLSKCDIQIINNHFQLL